MKKLLATAAIAVAAVTGGTAFAGSAMADEAPQAITSQALPTTAGITVIDNDPFTTGLEWTAPRITNAPHADSPTGTPEVQGGHPTTYADAIGFGKESSLYIGDGFTKWIRSMMTTFGAAA